MTDWDYMANVRDARHAIARDRGYAGTWIEALADALETVIGQRDDAVRELAESRARFADSEARRVELEAVVREMGSPRTVDGAEA